MAKSPRNKSATVPQLSFLDAPRESAPPPPPAPPERPRMEVQPLPPSRSAVPQSTPPRPQRPARRSTAEDMAQKQREISISEFFTKNRHLLGFDNPSKSLLTTVKEAVDNSLDACEEAGILPEIEVEITELGGDRYRVAVEDNGPGIVKQQIPKVFGKLLYGSKFHRLKQSRGQQGIGISAAVMYGQLTTGREARVLSTTGRRCKAHEFHVRIDTRSNNPAFTDQEIVWSREVRRADGTVETADKDHGTRVEIEMVANYVNGQRSVLRYLEQTALANPHATVRYIRPRQPVLEFPRSTHDLPREAAEIMPHPHGVELGMLMQRLAETKEKTLSSFLQNSFSRVSARASEEIIAAAGGMTVRTRPHGVTRDQAERLHKAMAEAKLPAPPVNCLSPIGDELMRKGLVSFLSVLEIDNPEMDQEAIAREAQLALPSAARARKEAKEAGARAEAAAAAGMLPGIEPPAVESPLEEGEEKIKGHRYFIATVTRPPKVYRGNPFQVEVGLAYGGSWPADRQVELYRMANRVPLLFQRGACGVTDAVQRTEWRKYELSQPKGSLPIGPMALLIHIASVWVPFTSESKEAIAHYPEILAEVRLALQEVGRKLASHLRKKKKAKYETERRNKFLLYIEELADSLNRLTGADREEVKAQFMDLALEITAGADFEKELETPEQEKRAAPPPPDGEDENE